MIWTGKHHVGDLLQKPQEPVCAPQPDAKRISKENAPVQETDEPVVLTVPPKPVLKKEATGLEPTLSNQTTAQFTNPAQAVDDVTEEQDEANQFGERHLHLPAWVLMVFTMLRLYLTKAFHTTVLRASAAIVYLEQRRKGNRPKEQEKAKPTNAVCEAPASASAADEVPVIGKTEDGMAGKKTGIKADKAKAHKRMVSHIFNRRGKQVGDPDGRVRFRLHIRSIQSARMKRNCRIQNMLGTVPRSDGRNRLPGRRLK